MNRRHLLQLLAAAPIAAALGASLDRQQTLFESYSLHGTAPCIGAERTWTVKLNRYLPNGYNVILAPRDNAEIVTYVPHTWPDRFEILCAGSRGWVDWAVIPN